MSFKKKYINSFWHNFILFNLLFQLNIQISFSASQEMRSLLLFQVENGGRSLITKNSPFFLHPEGYKDADKEWNRTVEIFSRPEEFLEQEKGHPQCLFPARLELLRNLKKIDVTKVHCPALEDWKEKVKGHKIYLVFAGQFISNPASIMGHTFFKFKHESLPPYLHKTLGYAANVKESDNSFSYAYKGLTGGYEGNVFENSYYEKVHEYSDMEQRDLWEYELKLSSGEKEKLLNFLWEIKNLAKFDYYFLDQNCSYMLLAFLEGAVPEKELTQGFGLFTTPYMTIQRLKVNGLLSEQNYIPSIREKLLAEYKELPEPDQELMIQSTRNNLFFDNKSSDFYETLTTAILYEKHRKEGKLSPEKREIFDKSLIARSRLPMNDRENIKVSSLSSPLNAHRPRHFSTGAGNQSFGHYQFIELRPGVHEATDPSAGFLPHSSFSFLKTNARYFPDNGRFDLGSISLVKLQNTNIYHPIDPKLSWKLHLGYTSQDLSTSDHGLYRGEFSMGFATELSELTLIFLQGIEEHISEHIKKGHTTWLKSTLHVRHEARSFLFDLSPVFMKSIWHGPNTSRWELNFDLRYILPKTNITMGPKILYQRLWSGKKSFFDHSLYVTYDF